MKSLSKLFLVLVLAIYGSNTVRAQASLKDDEARKAEEVKNLVNSGRYTFEVTKQVSQKGNSSVRSNGDLDVSKDTLIVYLSEAGKSPGAPVDAASPGITFTRFDYNMVAGKNGGWDVSIIPKGTNANKIKKITMDISQRGYTTLTITRTDQKKIEFYGYITQHIAAFPPVNSAL